MSEPYQLELIRSYANAGVTAVVTINSGALIAGLSLFAAAVVTLAQDLKLLLDNLMMMLFFVSGIFFDVDAIEEPMRGILLLNPMAVLLDAYRDVLLRAVWPDTMRLGGVCLLAVAFMAVGATLLVRFDRAYPKLVGK